jgi:hypothetical protein
MEVIIQTFVNTTTREMKRQMYFHNVAADTCIGNCCGGHGWELSGLVIVFTWWVGGSDSRLGEERGDVGCCRLVRVGVATSRRMEASSEERSGPRRRCCFIAGKTDVCHVLRETNRQN